MSLLCIVCHHDFSVRHHFGVTSCNACSAFFRRSVAKSCDYQCRRRKSCEIHFTIRSMCKYCRFSKCVSVGMRREAVQKFRDTYGKRLASEVSSPSPTLYPILGNLLENYNHLMSVRKIIHRKENASVFEDPKPRALNYKETIQLFLKEHRLIEDWIFNSFGQFSDIPDDQKRILFRNFYFQFILLEGGRFACQQGMSELTFLSSGDFIDCTNPETYYFDPDGKQPISAEEAAKIFSSSFLNYRRNVTYPMLRDNIDQFEFLALVALALFDTGIDGQTNECIDTCRNVRIAIQRELLQYCKSTRSEVDSSIRLANVLSILPGSQRAAQRLQEDMTVSNVIKAYSVDHKFYELGKI